jgi:hypothetical protein
MATYGGVEVCIHVFLALALDGGKSIQIPIALRQGKVTR